LLDPEEFAETMIEISRTRMPFGKYGPKEYPPSGVPIYDLPFEYLEWFQYNGGLPGGRLGELLEIVYHIKRDGSDEVFNPFRSRSGGRTRLRKKIKKPEL
jgi:uncharacterized protein (DUF3820 family)|tara:strand:- start:255 stop:554 length:300 start_codon:yes stop_codon:yes gene_type:complete